MTSPTAAAPAIQQPGGTVLAENIEQLVASRREFESKKTGQDHLADLMTKFSGSMVFVYVHATWFAVWMIVNSGLFGFPAFDEFPFGLLTVIVSLEAIFLSTFVLVSQNRMGALADKRAELDVHINLLAEHEVTELLVLVDAIAKHLGVASVDGRDLEELKEQVAPGAVLHEIAAREES